MISSVFRPWKAQVVDRCGRTEPCSSPSPRPRSRRKGTTLASLLSIAASVLLPCSPALAGIQSSGCDDLSGFAVQPRVDFAREIQPILDGCAGCHGEGGAAGLDLRAPWSYANLVGVTATTNRDAVRVVPFEPGASLLLTSLNCTQTGGPAFQMPGVAPEQRALVRDWIAQGAAQRPPPLAVPVFGPVSTAVALMLILLAAACGLRRRAA